MRNILIFSLISITVLIAGKCDSYTEYEIVTGDKDGTYYKMAQDLAKYVAPDACIHLVVRESKGSIDNINKLRSPDYDKVKFAIVQNDVMEFYLKKAKEGYSVAKDKIEHLRVIRPLYDEEIHIITRDDSKIESFKDLEGKVLSIGKRGGGSALTSNIIYEKLFSKELLKEGNYKFQNFNEAFKSLAIKRDVDAIVFVGGQPIPRLKDDIKPNAPIKLIEYKSNLNLKDITNSYKITTITKKKSGYSWMDRDIKTLNTKAYLITFNYKQSKKTRRDIKNFTVALNKKLSWLKDRASKNKNTPHIKWREVEDLCDIELRNAWKFYSVIENIIKSRCQNKKETDSNKKILNDLGVYY